MPWCFENTAYLVYRCLESTGDLVPRCSENTTYLVYMCPENTGNLVPRCSENTGYLVPRYSENSADFNLLVLPRNRDNLRIFFFCLCQKAALSWGYAGSCPGGTLGTALVVGLS